MKDSKTSTVAKRTKILRDPLTGNVVNLLISVDKPVGLIGQKVVYSEKYKKRVSKSDENRTLPLPECGYFIITKAVLNNMGVMVALHPTPDNVHTSADGTHLNIVNVSKYNQQISI